MKKFMQKMFDIAVFMTMFAIIIACAAVIVMAFFCVAIGEELPLSLNTFAYSICIGYVAATLRMVCFGIDWFFNKFE